VFTANATAKVTMSGADVLRSTNSSVASSGPGGSGPAVKTYQVPPATVLGEQFTRAPLALTGQFLLRNIWFALIMVLIGTALVIGARRRQRRA
jgi:hypothetical protein